MQSFADKITTQKISNSSESKYKKSIAEYCNGSTCDKLDMITNFYKFCKNKLFDRFEPMFFIKSSADMLFYIYFTDLFAL